MTRKSCLLGLSVLLAALGFTQAGSLPLLPEAALVAGPGASSSLSSGAQGFLGLALNPDRKASGSEGGPGCETPPPSGLGYEPPDPFCRIELPMAAFSFSVNGTVVTFVNDSTDATSFLWNFGDGTSSTATNPTHDYGPFVPPDTTQLFTVILTASNPRGFDSVIQLVQVTGPASAAP